MMDSWSPGSPSQWNATRSPWPFSTWRSTALWQTLSFPPTNHLANGSSHSRTVSQGSNQSTSSAACLAQKASGSASASA